MLEFLPRPVQAPSRARDGTVVDSQLLNAKKCL